MKTKLFPRNTNVPFVIHTYLPQMDSILTMDISIPNSIILFSMQHEVFSFELLTIDYIRHELEKRSAISINLSDNIGYSMVIVAYNLHE